MSKVEKCLEVRVEGEFGWPRISRNMLNTLFEIFIFCPKIQLWFPEKNCRIVLGENSWKCCSFELFSCFDFTRKIVKKIWGEKLWFPEKIVKFWCQNWIFRRKMFFKVFRILVFKYHFTTFIVFFIAEICRVLDTIPLLLYSFVFYRYSTVRLSDYTFVFFVFFQGIRYPQRRYQVILSPPKIQAIILRWKAISTIHFSVGM